MDWKVNVNTQRCANVTEGANGKCENGQASFWYSTLPAQLSRAALSVCHLSNGAQKLRSAQRQ